MKSRKIWNLLLSLAASGMLAAAAFVVLDSLAVFLELRMVPAVFFCILSALFVLFQFCKVFTLRRKGKLLLGLAAMAALVCALSWAIWYPFQKNGAYADPDMGKEALYGGRDVMVIVPHQDDEANILGGVLEEFRDYGSNVRVVFSTNGDNDGIPYTRMEEAIAYCAYAGIPEENVIFLGYGDRWDIDTGLHLYNAPAGMAVPSRYGAMATYGLDDHPAYNPDHEYTVENFLKDLKSVILEYTPELIFCIDYDDHIEHKALSLAFEKVMGEILKEDSQYRPVVLKAYAYGAAWFAEDDFYGIQIQSTKDIFAQPYLQQPAAYRWEQGIRFPVDGGTLSRSLVNSDAFRSLELYTSQDAQYRAMGIVNGDRIFWQRRTDSLCLGADIQVSSGDGQLLNNFMRADNFDLREQADPLNGIWIPDEKDTEKTVTVNFPEESAVDTVVLCDNPSVEHNILNAVLLFDDGTSVETGPLNPSGAATEIALDRKNVRSFQIKVTETEGNQAGLGEIEAYCESSQGDLRLVKLMDPEGNFVYDYRICEGDQARFRVYTYGDVPEVNSENYTVSCDNPHIRVWMEADWIVAECPEGEQGTVHLSCKEEALADSIAVGNPGKLWQLHTKLGQRIEKFAVFQFRESIVSRVGRRIAGMLK